jgi:hypothetical protein
MSFSQTFLDELIQSQNRADGSVYARRPGYYLRPAIQASFA